MDRGLMGEKVLMTMFNVAPWGGLHENVWYTCKGLKRHGWDVTVACRNGPLIEKLKADGVGVHVIDSWDDWHGDSEALSQRHWDVVHSHPIRSRELALEVASATGAKLVSTFHGYNTDRSYQWHEQATSLMAVSRAHAQMLIDDAHIPPWKVFVVPNGVPDEVFDESPRSFEEKTADGTARVLVASRLDADKRAIFTCIDQLTDVIAQDDLGLKWIVDVAGDGSVAGEVNDFLRTQAAKSDSIEFRSAGWIDSVSIPGMLRESVFSVASGRGAAQSLAVGTPTIAFGSRGVYGFQVGGNLQLGLWGNFGGYPIEAATVKPIADEARAILGDKQAYAEVQSAGRQVAFAHLLQSDCDRAIDGIFRL